MRDHFLMLSEYEDRREGAGDFTTACIDGRQTSPRHMPLRHRAVNRRLGRLQIEAPNCGRLEPRTNTFGSSVNWQMASTQTRMEGGREVEAELGRVPTRENMSDGCEQREFRPGIP
jgi:hypothetical protein